MKFLSEDFESGLVNKSCKHILIQDPSIPSRYKDSTMSEIIDLEELDYESIYAQETLETDRHSGLPTKDSVSDGKIGQQPRMITIKSYTEICIEAKDSPVQEESSPRAKPKFKQEKEKDYNSNNKLPDQVPDTKRKFSVPKVKFPKTKDKVNVWTKQGKAELKKKERAPCWLVVFIFCCGVSKEYPWYSLLGKGVLLTFFLSLIYLVACLTVLPFIIIAAAVGAVFFGAGMVSYLAFSSKKIGVSFDEDGDTSCIRAVWGSWV